jgi:hypothetical protein
MVAHLLACALVLALVCGHELVWRRSRRGVRAIVACAAAGYLFTAALAFGLYTCRGVATTRSGYTVHTVLEGFDAAGKLREGDHIIAIDGVQLAWPATPSLVQTVNGREGAAVTLGIIRDGSPLLLVVQPKLDRRRDGDLWVLGIRPRLEYEYEVDAGLAARLAVRAPVDALVRVGHLLNAEPPADPSGPAQIIEVTRIQAEPDGWTGSQIAVLWSSLALWVLLVIDGVRALRARVSPR